tara:strand:+ start:52440 stop:53279 length:840 start_codon:yes stop_codon:yes gene_type:complete
MANTTNLFGTSDPAYAYTWKLSRSRWAWEFLRRNPRFLEDASRHDPEEVSYRPACRSITLVRPRCDQAEAERWGLAFFPDVRANGFEADVFWSGALYPRTVSVHVGPRGEHELCEIYEETTRLCNIVHLTDRVGREHLLLKGDGCVVQVRCEGLSLLCPEPVRMQIVLDGVSDLDAKMKILAKAREIYKHRQEASAPVWTRHRRALCHALIALDCHMAGLSHYETACVIYGPDRAAHAWGEPGGAMKGEMKRALKKGLHYKRGGYTELLGASKPLAHAA